MTDPESVVAATRRWVADVVIGLNLCPFAGKVFDAGFIRFAVTDAADEDALIDVLSAELTALAAAPRTEVETTLLIHPGVLAAFLDYNDFLGTADRVVRALGLNGVIQIASFHPDYQFAGTDPDAAENYTNRSPFPMLHLLREASVTEVAADPAALLGIPERNIATLRALGRAAMVEMLRAARGDRQ